MRPMPVLAPVTNTACFGTGVGSSAPAIGAARDSARERTTEWFISKSSRGSVLISEPQSTPADVFLSFVQRTLTNSIGGARSNRCRLILPAAERAEHEVHDCAKRLRLQGKSQSEISESG